MTPAQSLSFAQGPASSALLEPASCPAAWGADPKQLVFANTWVRSRVSGRNRPCPPFTDDGAYLSGHTVLVGFILADALHSKTPVGAGVPARRFGLTAATGGSYCAVRHETGRYCTTLSPTCAPWHPPRISQSLVLLSLGPAIGWQKGPSQAITSPWALLETSLEQTKRHSRAKLDREAFLVGPPSSRSGC
jgi:hypothetical protein